MAEPNDISVLRRMAGTHATKVGPAAMTVSKALRTALAHGGDEAMKIAVGMRDFQQNIHLPEDLTDELPETALFLMLRGPAGSIGVAIACPQVLGAIIEAATMGKVLERPSPERAATRTDAALVSAFLKPVLDMFGPLSASCDPPMPFSDYSTSTLLRDARAALMVLADAAHVKMTAEIDFGLGAKIGNLTLILPETPPTAAPECPDQAEWSSTIKTVVLGTQAAMEAELCRLALPLAEITKFEVGQTVPLGHTTLDDVQLIGPDDAPVTRVRLGRSGALRAIKLSTASVGAKTVPARVPEFETGTMPDQPLTAAAPLSEEPEVGTLLGEDPVAEIDIADGIPVAEMEI